MDSSILLHYGTIGATIALGATGIAFGEGIIAQHAMQAQFTQPGAQKDLARISLIAMALTETAAILSLVIVMVLFFGINAQLVTWPQALARLGILASVGVTALVVGIVSSYPASAAMDSIARQPLTANRIMNIMLLTMALIQTPVIFGFLIALLINAAAGNATSIYEGWQLCAAGLAIGLGAIGPAIGQGIFARAVCTSVGIRRHAYQQLVSFALFSMALIETPILFACLISFLLIGTITITSDSQMVGCIMGAFTMGIGTLMPGIASAKVAATACTTMTNHPNQQADITRTSLLLQTFIDTFPIYCLMVSIVLLFFSK